MKQFIKMFCSIMLLFGMFVLPSHAEEQETIMIYRDLQDDEKIMEEVNTILTNHPEAHVQVIDANYVMDTKHNTFNGNQTYAMGYRVGAVTCAAPFHQVRNTVIAMAIGSPGVTISISETKAVSSTYSASFGANISLISTAVGFNVTGTRSIEIKGSYTVPSVGVRTKLIAKPVDEVYNYTVYYNGTKKGSGIARRAIGVDFSTQPA
ncbi:MAG: hypothetical protein HFF01_05880 [Erysipelotrichaceae bacterium]|nr:hypothetical protein [Erysipelotrichaceae bacterium]MCI9524568.1 hypothetical protein [Erysipelotrichaceae bacterium]